MFARNVLWFMVFTGFAVNYMIRINLNIAIVDMVEKKKHAVVFNVGNYSECYRGSQTNVMENQSLLLNDRGAKFEWNEYEQGLVLGAFYWFHWLTQLPGGLLAQTYGTKKVYGFANLFGIICCILIPSVSYLSLNSLIVLRCLQGVFCGFAWPSMHNMTAKWIPPNERSKFVTAYLGSSVGAAVTFPLCGLIIDRFDWKIVFYVTGTLGLIWFAFWWSIVYDSPETHPTISTSEKKFILDSLGNSVYGTKKQIPWRHILASVSLWTNIIAQWGGIWGLYTVLTHAPTYFRFIHGWNIRMTGLFSGIPHLLRMIFALFFSFFGDYLLKTNRMSRTNVRKLATFFCTVCQGFFMLMVAFSGCQHTLSIIALSLATTVNGAVSTGPLASLVDISPNYASISLGICNTCVALVGFIVPLIVGVLTKNHQTIDRWQIVFMLAAAVLIVCGLTFICFAKSEIEWWNSYGTRPNKSRDATRTAGSEVGAEQTKSLLVSK